MKEGRGQLKKKSERRNEYQVKVKQTDELRRRKGAGKGGGGLEKTKNV